MSNRAPVRRLLLAAGIGLALIGSGPVAAADPGAEVPVPGLVNAVATCEHGTATIQVEVDDNRDAPLPVRLDRLRPDTATLTAGTVLDEKSGMHVVVFEPVPVGEYNVHVERGDGKRPDDVPAVVKPCTDLRPTDELLRVEVECQAGWGLASFVVANPRTKDVVRYDLTNTNFGAHVIHLSEGLFLRITENLFDDGTYTAFLTEGAGDGAKQVAAKEFTVACEAGNAPRLDVTAACAGSTGTVTVGLLNPNRRSVNYEVSLKDATVKLTVNGGEKGSVTFPGIATGEHAVTVKGEDQTQARGVAKSNCAQTTTTTTTDTTTTTPAPQGRSEPGLANTGASVGGLVGLAALAIVLGGVLFMIGRRRAHGSR
jgi:hypothetical protein